MTRLIFLDQENAISLAPGTGIKIECGRTKRMAASLFVGALTGTHLVVLPPEQAGEKDVFICEAGSPLDVNYVLDGAMIRFTTKVLRLVADPLPLLVLEFPANARRYELRGHKRISCFLATAITIHNEVLDKSLSGTIRDISKTGCRLCFVCEPEDRGIFSLNEKITLRCQFPGIAGEQESCGVVRDIRIFPNEIHVGIQFLETAWWVPPYEL